jgi:4-amino-4-deoxy-L-arabinose transferase-like glycosyltransferase
MAYSPFRKIKVNRSRKLALSAIFCCFILWSFFLLKIPTLDFDEALYRRVADSMKAEHNPRYLNWDTRILFHKPPILYWLIWMFSNLIDGAKGAVSTFAARLPSFFSSVGIIAYLYLSGKRFETNDLLARKRAGGFSIGQTSALAFLCGLFPLLTATAVLFDPLQTLCLMPALVIPSVLFFQDGKLKHSDWVFWCLSLFAANATKGLNGMIVPTVAFGLHCLWAIRTYGFKRVMKLALQFLGFVFLPAVVLTFAYYAWLDHQIGPAFTHEFIWVQHFERGTQAMEQHTGTFFYHFLVIFFGGGILIPLLLERAFKVRAQFLKYGFPLTYALSFMVIFGLSATKLPHYSWPVWPALALYVGIISGLPRNLILAAEAAARKNRDPKKLIALIPVILIGVLSLALTLIKNSGLTSLTHSPSFQAVLMHYQGLNPVEVFAFLACTFFCAVFIVFKDLFLARIEWCAMFSTVIALCFTFGIARTLDDLMVKPFYEIAERIKQDGAVVTDCIRYSGTLSPTFSLALSPELIHNRCEPGNMKYLVAPEWKTKECKDLNFKMIDQKSYLVICKKG